MNGRLKSGGAGCICTAARLLGATLLAAACAGCADERTDGEKKGATMATQEIRSKATVMRNDGRVWIGELEELRWDWSQTNSTLRSLAIALRTVGEDVSYEYLMGASGLAFRLQLHDVWCPSSPHICCGWNGGLPLVRQALPLQLDSMEAKSEDTAGVTAICKAVTASIDTGVPVLFGSEEDGLLVGYEKGGDVLLCHSYWKMRRPEWSAMDKWPWGFGLLRARDDAPDRKACIRRSLEAAVTLWVSPRQGDYDCGRAAWERWIRELRDEKLLSSLEGEPYRVRMQGNAHIFHSLVDARNCAAAYLSAVAPALDGASRQHVEAARDLYRTMADDVFGHDDADRIAPFAGKPGESPAWTQEQRNRQAEILARALELEKQAVAELTYALAKM